MKTRPCLTDRLLMGRKESNQTKTNYYSCEGGVEKSIPRVHSASPVMPIGDPRDSFWILIL